MPGGNRRSFLDEKPPPTISLRIHGLRWIKKNPAKPSAAAMRLLAEKLEVIEATGVLGIDLEWLNSNYQRALFHYVRKCSAHRLRELGRPVPASISRSCGSSKTFVWKKSVPSSGN